MIDPGRGVPSCASVAAEPPRQLDVELAEVNVADALEELGGPGVGEGLGQLVAPGLVFGLQGPELGQGPRPHRFAAASVGPAAAPGPGRRRRGARASGAAVRRFVRPFVRPIELRAPACAGPWPAPTPSSPCDAVCSAGASKISGSDEPQTPPERHLTNPSRAPVTTRAEHRAPPWGASRAGCASQDRRCLTSKAIASTVQASFPRNAHNTSLPCSRLLPSRSIRECPGRSRRQGTAARNAGRGSVRRVVRIGNSHAPVVRRAVSRTPARSGALRTPQQRPGNGASREVARGSQPPAALRCCDSQEE